MQPNAVGLDRAGAGVEAIAVDGFDHIRVGVIGDLGAAAAHRGGTDQYPGRWNVE